MVTYNYKEYRF